jgi:hypothetical protein
MAITLWLPASHAVACELGKITSGTITIPMEIDKKPQNIGIEKRYIFSEKKSKANTTLKSSTTTKAIEESYIIFPEFTEIYTNFASLRVGPKKLCDKISTFGFKTTADKNGMAYGRFMARYEDRFCFGLRFFTPQPGVEKEPMGPIISQGVLEVSNAFNPKIVPSGNGGKKLIIETATSYSGEGKQRTLKRLYKYPLDKFLHDELFIQLIDDTVSGLGKNDLVAGFNPVSAKFIKGKNNQMYLRIESQKLLSKENACQFKDTILASGRWRPY